MKIKSLPKQGSLFLAAGLLLIAFTQLLARYVILPDFVRGALTGVGIGLEIIAATKIASARKRGDVPTENQ